MNVTSSVPTAIASAGDSTSPLGATTSPNGPDSLRKVSKQLEGIFYTMMLKEMRKTVPADGLLPDDAHQQEIFQEMMDDHVAQQMANQTGSTGLGAQLYKQLSGQRAYAAQKSPSTTNNSTDTSKDETNIVR